jgi:4-amino-4-deoxy-L-arabinose transferase-like glycosyltransferase
MAPTTTMQAPAAGSRAKVSSRRKRYALLILVGFALRFGFVIWARTYVGSANTMTPFGAEVCRIATHIAAGEGFRSPFHGGDTGPSAWVAPVYPYLVAAVFRLFGNYTATSALILLGLQCMMGAGTGVAISEIGMRSLGERVGTWAAWIWTVSPIFFRWPASWIWDFAASALLLTLTFVMTFAAGETARRGKWLALGAIWGLIALTNPALLTLLPFSFLHAAWSNRKAGRPWIRASIYALATFVVIISPWLVRNYVVFGRPVFLRDNYWFEFSLGNYHNSNGMGYSGKHPDNNPAIYNQVAKMGELGFIAYHKKEALEFVRQYPREFVELTLHRAWWFWDGTFLTYQGNEWWSPWEFWPLSAIGWLGLLFVFTRRPPGWLLYAAALVVYPVPYYFAYPQAKYRHAIEPQLLLLGVYLVFIVWREIAGSRGAQTGN